MNKLRCRVVRVQNTVLCDDKNKKYNNGVVSEIKYIIFGQLVDRCPVCESHKRTVASLHLNSPTRL